MAFGRQIGIVILIIIVIIGIFRIYLTNNFPNFNWKPVRSASTKPSNNTSTIQTTGIKITENSTSNTIITKNQSKRGSNSTNTSKTTNSISNTTNANSSLTPSPIKHLIIIVLENEGYADVMGSSSAPYINSISKSYASATQYYAIAHPSLPNYISMIAGSSFGINDDGYPADSLSQKNIADLLSSARVTWKAYMQSIPQNCYLNDSGQYAARHNPFIYFKDIADNASRCSNVVSLSSFNSSLASNNLPSFSFISPNLLNDGHDTSLNYSDAWLSAFLPKIISSQSFASTAVFLVWDEGSDNAGFGALNGGRVALILVSPFAKTNYQSYVRYSHYSLLSTTECLLGVPHIGTNDTTTGMPDLFSINITSYCQKN